MASRKLIVEVIGDASSLDKTFKKLDRTTSSFGKNIGRNIGFAVGGLVGTAGLVNALKASINEATEAQVAQKQLAAQFKASGQELSTYQAQIDKTVNSLSIMAGIEDEEVKDAFTSAFRVTQNVTQGLRITAIAADVAKGKHISLATATTALNKAYAGQTTSLKRLGIIVPSTLKGMEALEFVGRRFAGQAAAGTTAQDRFSIALKNMEQAIGTALLPVFEEYLGKLTEWLGDTKNQKKVQDLVTEAVDKTTVALEGLAAAIDVARKAWKDYNKYAPKTGKAPGPLGEILKTIFVPGYGAKKLLEAGGYIESGKNIAGQSNRPIGRGMSPIGENAMPNLNVSAAAVSAASTRLPGPAGFRARMAKLDIAFARAQMTQGQKDDRAVLVAQMELVRQRIKRVKSLKDRRDLYGQLANLDGQIKQIDKDAQDAIDAANQKKLDAKQEEARKAKAAADKLKAAHKKAVEAARDAMQAAVAGARDMVGALFGGPVLSGAAGILGVSNARAIGGRAGIGALTADVKAQTAQASGFARDLRTLKKRGASGRLLGELSAQGMAGAGFAHTLATAKAGDLKTFLKAFAEREKVVQQIAHADVHAKNVYINSSHVRAGATPTSQRRGRNGGTRGPSYLGFPTR